MSKTAILVSYPAIVVLGALFLLPASAVIQQREGEAQIERGEYLVTVADCAGCHTPPVLTPDGPVPDTARHLSG